MMKSNSLVLLLAVGLVMPGTLLAQHAQHHPQAQDQPQQGMMGQSMMTQGMMNQGTMGQMHGMMGMMSAPGPGMILMQKEALSLSESQVERLKSLQDQATQARQSLMGEIMPLRRQAEQALKRDDPDVSGYESALKKIADYHVKAQVEMAGYSQQALALLTPEQRSNVRYAARLMQDMMGGGMMGGGMMGAGMMGAMMQGGGMSGCPMMGQAEQEGN